MTDEIALPTAEQAAASQAETEAARLIDNDANAGELTIDQQAEKDAESKPEKTDAERERARMQRGIDRKTRQAAEARAEANHLRQEVERLTRGKIGVNYDATSDDSEPVSLTKSQLAELVKAEAAKLAPTIQQEAAERDRRNGVVKSLESAWGKEKFDTISNDLDEAFDGLLDRSGQPKPALEAVFEADNPTQVIEFLSDPENVDEAEKVSKMSAAQAGKYIAKLEAKLSEKPDGKPKASKAPAPLESIRRSSPTVNSGLSDDLTADEWRARRNKQLRERNN